MVGGVKYLHRCMLELGTIIKIRRPGVTRFDAAANAAERHLVSPEIIAYHKWLIYSAAF